MHVHNACITYSAKSWSVASNCKFAASILHLWLFRPIGAHQCSALTNHSILQCHVSSFMGWVIYLCLTKPMTGKTLHWTTKWLLACWINQRRICTIPNARPVDCRSVTLLAYSFSFSSHWETHTHTGTRTHARRKHQQLHTVHWHRHRDGLHIGKSRFAVKHHSRNFKGGLDTISFSLLHTVGKR